ncbi:MAG: hypothetical protein CMB99_01350 [Flavobacteriaceae bacterium]|nr:hypothetical protein [Flavobacteriaceae bacterium]|tara:strand:+ start:1054 stop:1278 length:225 start_codon:yes stop_codon:yes gene_type:complete
MPMSGPVLAAAVKASIAVKNPDFVTKVGTDLDWLIDAICEEVVTHVQTTAVVNTTVATTGGPVAQAGTGVGTIT